MPTPDTHEWVTLEQNGKPSPYYYCRVCHVSGKKVGSAWPPIRDPKFAMPEYASCEGARRAMAVESLKKFGVSAEDIEL